MAVPHTTHILAQPLCSPEDIQRTCVRLSRAHACPRPCRPAGRPGAQPARARRCCGPRRRGCCKRRRRRARRGRRRRGACSRTGPARAGCGAAAAGLCAGAGAPRRPPMRCLHSRQPEQAHVPGLYTSVDDARAPGHCVLVGWCGCPQLSLPRDHRRLASSRHPCWLPAAARIAIRVGLGHCSNASLLTADTHISVRAGCCRLLLQLLLLASRLHAASVSTRHAPPARTNVQVGARKSLHAGPYMRALCRAAWRCARMCSPATRRPRRWRRWARWRAWTAWPPTRRAHLPLASNCPVSHKQRLECRTCTCGFACERRSEPC